MPDDGDDDGMLEALRNMSAVFFFKSIEQLIYIYIYIIVVYETHGINIFIYLPSP